MDEKEKKILVNILMFLGALMSIVAGFLVIYDYFSKMISTTFALRSLLILCLYIIFLMWYSLKTGLRHVLAIAGAILLLLSIPFFINPWALIRNVTHYLGAERIEAWAKNSHITTEFARVGLRFSGFSSEKDTHELCQKIYHYQCRGVSFELFRSTAPPWKGKIVAFRAMTSSSDWTLSGLQLFNIGDGKELKHPGYPSDVRDTTIRQRDIKLGSGTLGFRVVVCGNPQKDEATRSALYEILDIVEIEAKDNDID